MERSKEYFMVAMLTAVASISIVSLYKKYKGELETPRGISIQRASIRNSSLQNMEEGPNILNALYIHAQESAKQGI
jgi:hypothetical protein